MITQLNFYLLSGDPLQSSSILPSESLSENEPKFEIHSDQFINTVTILLVIWRNTRMITDLKKIMRCSLDCRSRKTAEKHGPR